jgi:hypothetical protein
VGGVFLAHFVLLRRQPDVEALYRTDMLPAFNIAGLTAWIAGFAMYTLAAPIGATLPSLLTSILIYSVLASRRQAFVT